MTLFRSNCSMQSKGHTVSHKNTSTAQINTHRATLNLTNTDTHTHAHYHDYFSTLSPAPLDPQHVLTRSGKKATRHASFQQHHELHKRNTLFIKAALDAKAVWDSGKSPERFQHTTNNAIDQIEENSIHLHQILRNLPFLQRS